MRFLILNIDYPEFLGWLYTQHPGLENQPYEEQMRARNESLFAWADFYPSNLRELGHEARNIYVSNKLMQKAWAQEHGVRVEEAGPLHAVVRDNVQLTRYIGYRTPLRHLRPLFKPLLEWLGRPASWYGDIMLAQVSQYKPDIVLNMNISLSSQLLRQAKSHTRLLVGQHASSMTQRQDLGIYDLMLSSLPCFVDYFRGQGMPSEPLRLGFEPAVLDRLGKAKKSEAVSFIGSLFEAHGSRRRWLEYVCRRTPVGVWAHGVNGLPRDSGIMRSYRGKAWGLEMYRILQRSRITLNHHIDVAEQYANNMRLFEATGVGTFLITDAKKNLHEMFEPGEEVVAYRSPDECVELMRYYLEHDAEREAIAQAGQRRTLRDHTYYQRMQELVDIVRRYI